jgi:hypothetical protein
LGQEKVSFLKSRELNENEQGIAKIERRLITASKSFRFPGIK